MNQLSERVHNIMLEPLAHSEPLEGVVKGDLDWEALQHVLGTTIEDEEDMAGYTRVCQSLAMTAVSSESCNGELRMVLLSTMLIERAVVDLFWAIANEKPPPLFRNLLQHDAMKQLGPLRGFFRALMGHPLGLNLRNVLWHGFMFRVPPPYVALLRVVERSMPALCTRFESFESRRNCQRIALSDAFLERLPPTINIEKMLLCCHHFDVPQLEPFLEESRGCFARGQFVESLALLFVAFECELRARYCRLNHLEHLAQTADNITLYTTLETFVQPTLIGSETTNHLIENLGASSVMAVLDLCFLPRGPRLRDRLSHGEIVLADLTPQLCQLAWAVVTGVLGVNRESVAWISAYRSCAHPRALALRALEVAMHQRESVICYLTDMKDDFHEIRHLACIVWSIPFLYKDNDDEAAHISCFWASEGAMRVGKKCEQIADALSSLMQSLLKVLQAQKDGDDSKVYRIVDETRIAIQAARIVENVLAHWAHSNVFNKHVDRALLELLSFVTALRKSTLRKEGAGSIVQRCHNLPKILDRFKKI